MELKARTARSIADEEEMLELGADCPIEPAQVYLKSEADNVIADLEDKLRAANEQIENLINSASSIMLFQDRVKDNKCDELRHNKYKRCLYKAEMCQARYDEEDAKENGHYSSWKYTSDEMKYWERWQKRWLELAEKFKEAK